MANIEKWSASKLKCYQDCPYKFYCQYILKLVPDGNQKALTFGNCFHQCAEYFFDDFIFPSKDMLLNYYEQNWISEPYVKNWAKSQKEHPEVQRWQFLGYDSDVEEKQYFEMGKKMISDFWDKHCSIRYLPFAIEMPFNEQLPTGDRFIGFMDRIDYVNSRFKILDYKTGKWESSSDDLKKDFQLGLYHWAFCKKYNLPYSSVEYCALYYVRSSNLVPVTFMGGEIEKLLDQVSAIITKVKSNYFPKTPKKVWMCKNCPYKDKNPCDGV